MKPFFLALALLTATPLALSAEPVKAEAVSLMIMTNNGVFDFSVPRSWSLIESEKAMPIAYMTFKIPNPAEAGTKDSSILSITAFDDSDEKAKEMKNSILGKTLGTVAPVKSTYKQWTQYTQQANQGATTYTIMDAAKKASGATIHVRMAWPHLADNPAGFNADMKKTYISFIDSVDFMELNWSN